MVAVYGCRGRRIWLHERQICAVELWCRKLRTCAMKDEYVPSEAIWCIIAEFMS